MDKKLQQLEQVRAEIAEHQRALDAAPARTRADVLTLATAEADRLQALVDKAAGQALRAAQGGRALVLDMDRLPPGAVLLAAMGRKAFAAWLAKHADALPEGTTAADKAQHRTALDDASRREVALMRDLEAAGHPVEQRPDADPIFDLEHDDAI